MSGDDDWGSPSTSMPMPPSGNGVNGDGGCKFSAGRGFTPAMDDGSGDGGWGQADEGNSWGGGATNGDNGWGNNSEPASDSWGDNSGGGGRGGRGGRGGGRGGRGGRGGGRGGYSRDNDGDGGDRGEGGGFRGGRGGRGGGRGRDGDRDNENGEEGGEEVKKEYYIPPERDDDELFDGISSGVNFIKLDDAKVNVTGNDPPTPITSFESSGLRPHLLDNVTKSGYTKPTAVQKFSIPAIMNGRDLMSCAQTGSGKTAAFLLPILHSLLENKNPPVVDDKCAQPNVIIVSPTRELAIQISDQGKKFAYNSTVKVLVAYGGTSSNHQRGKIMNGCHVLVATPGRLKDYLNRGNVSFASVSYFVLDEADRMLDMGFLEDVKEMMAHPSMPPTGERQTLMFSATFPEEIQALAAKFLHNYIFLAVGIVGSASTDVEQNFYQISKFEKRQKLLDLLKESPNERTLIFVETKRNADFLATFLSEKNIKSTSIHGDRLQREREQALWDFKKGIRKIMVATGVAARGLDIKDVQHVINYDLPKSIDEYVHRIGRTGRVGNKGKATSFFDGESDRGLAGSLSTILTQAGQNIPDWLGSAGYGTNDDQFGGRDIREDNFGQGENFSAAAVADDDEVW